jgi:hypothetical protein
MVRKEKVSRFFRKAERGSGAMNPEAAGERSQETLAREDRYRRAVADLIRERSAAGRLALPDEIVLTLRGEAGFEPANGGAPGRDAAAIIRDTMKQNADLREISGHDGVPRYYSEQDMSDAYARLLVQKEGDPLLLIAATVRESSQVYPRPVSRDTFKNEPFSLTAEEILICLEKMKTGGPYDDIAQTVTSEGGVYLYSTLHLDPDYAAMLAEWVDVGQYRNP